tara:strand:- start:445 stop:1266 length:822 start_codon:yes stop_codon:yes gene_type:complete
MTSFKDIITLQILSGILILCFSNTVIAQTAEQTIDEIATELTEWLYGTEITNPDIKKSNPLTRGIYFGPGEPIARRVIRDRTNEFFEKNGISYTQRWTIGEGDTDASRMLHGSSFRSRIKIDQYYFQLSYQENVGIFQIIHVEPNVSERFNELTSGKSLSEVTISKSKTPNDAINWLLLYFSNEYMGEEVNVNATGGDSDAIVRAISMNSYTTLDNFKKSMSESMEKLGVVSQGSWEDDDWGTSMFIELAEYEFKLDYMSDGNVLFIVYGAPK